MQFLTPPTNELPCVKVADRPRGKPPLKLRKPDLVQLKKMPLEELGKALLMVEHKTARMALVHMKAHMALEMTKVAVVAVIVLPMALLCND